jgi:excisionase family DNA binding protein
MSGTKKAPVAALMEDLTVTVDEAAALLGLSRNSAYSAVRDHTLPSVRIGRAIRIPSAKLRALLGVDREQTVA